MKTAVLIIAHEMFRDEEYAYPKEILEKAGIQTTTASIKLGTAKGKLGMTANVDIALKDIKPADYDAVIFVGGPGCYDLYDDKEALRIAKETVAASKILASICSAGGILAHAGVLKGIRATVFPGEAELLKSKGAIYTAAGVEVDGKIIAADGPQSARKFGGEILRALSS